MCAPRRTLRAAAGWAARMVVVFCKCLVPPQGSRQRSQRVNAARDRAVPATSSLHRGSLLAAGAEERPGTPRAPARRVADHLRGGVRGAHLGGAWAARRVPRGLRQAGEAGAVARLAAVRRRGQHRVLGGDPPLARVPHPTRHVLIDRRRTQHACVAERHEHRSLSGASAGS